MSAKEHESITDAKKALEQEFEALEDKSQILRSKTFSRLYSGIKKAEDKARYGAAVNEIKKVFEKRVKTEADNKESQDLRPIDITAPASENSKMDEWPQLLSSTKGSKHPLSIELERVIDIFSRMGFTIEDSRQLDDDYHMFGSLNFPADHPARDDYDTFMTKEGLIPPAHTSTMQNRTLRKYEPPIRAVVPGRTFRNEDVDATHEHTFLQVEGVYVDEGITLADMLGTIQAFLESYFEQEIEFKTQPFYFPFVEPGLEFLIKMPESLKKAGQSGDQWLEIMGCGMIHPNVLSEGGIDPEKFSGFAWGFGLDRLVMLRHQIEDIRHFNSGRIAFLEKF